MPAWATGAQTGLVRSATADSVVVEKGEHRMTLFAGGQAVGKYLIALGKRPIGAKEAKGDFRTPEGLYHIDARNAGSQYHRALHVSYPNDVDRARAQTLGVDPGGDIMIHGLPNGQGAVGLAHRSYDWTNGCVAVTDQEIEEIWSAVPIGTPVRIKP
jgi:murein L,D-transpeptidase YafK